jgi:hypothetical protein
VAATGRAPRAEDEVLRFEVIAVAVAGEIAELIRVMHAVVLVVTP